MKVIQITDDDCKELVQDLELQKYRLPTWWESSEVNVSPEDRESLQTDMHRHFHFVVTKWLLKHGARLS